MVRDRVRPHCPWCGLRGASALWRPHRQDRFISSGRAFLAAGLVLVSLATAYLTVSPQGDTYSHGTGVWLGLISALIVLAGGASAALRMRAADGPARAGTRELASMVVLALFLGLAGASGSWILDQRSNAAQVATELAAEAEGPTRADWPPRCWPKPWPRPAA